MTADTPPIAAPEATKKVYERKTRVPDWLTDVVLIVTGAFGVWSVILVGMTFLSLADPAYYTTDQKAFLKAIGSTVVVILTFSQFYTMESVLGHLPRGSIKMRSMMRVHRWGGRIIIVLAAVIAFYCMVDVGAPTETTRQLVHVIAGTLAFVLLGIKFALIRFKPYLAYDTAPWIGRIVAVCFVAIWISSGYAYLTGVGVGR